MKALSLPEDNINAARASECKAYILAETGRNYLVWIPQDENMHMPEEYRAKDPDGFAVFVLNGY